jgi:antitoxin ParD1/3/4
MSSAFSATAADMTISLTQERRARTNARIERGEFVSMEEAVQQLIEERIRKRELEEIDDLAWAKPLVDEALAEVERGEFISREEHQARMDAHVASMKE